MLEIKRTAAFPENASYDEMDSPVGPLILVTSPLGLHAIFWDKESLKADWVHDPKEKTIVETKKQLEEYFHKKRKVFDLPLVLTGTDFQIEAWKQLMKIPYGKTLSYSEQAQKLGDIKKMRAVGGANGKNPISIVIPCHRVIGKNGKLVGFGGGLNTKAYLLELEKGIST